MAVDKLVSTLEKVVAKQLIPAGSGPVLLVDDNPLVLRWMKRCLESDQRTVISCASAREALARVSEGNIQVVVSDISMPVMSGLELLWHIHEIDADLPVILLTGVPSIDTAATAVEYGAFTYLVKPASPEALDIAIERALQAFATAKRRREHLAWLGVADEATQLSTLECAFESSLSNLWLAYQPIVRFSEREAFAYEALLRSDCASLNNPEAILHAAERLGVLNRLGRAVRGRAADSLDSLPKDSVLFVNLHPEDLMDTQLLDSRLGLSPFASRIVLEITERCGLAKFECLSAKVRELRTMGYRIAVDDLGAGHSGLANVAMLEPEFIKLDMALVRNIDQSTVKQKLVGSLVSLSNAMGHSIIAEGVETPEECETLLGLGCDLLQGFLFAKPERQVPEIQWHQNPNSMVAYESAPNEVRADSHARLIAARQVSQACATPAQSSAATGESSMRIDDPTGTT
jgi:EAL domain-containing protein (putative c-di-GMP-specific phosphodiesterase class I)